MKNYYDDSSVLQELRRLIPHRDRVMFSEALRIAEQQAARLLFATGSDEAPISKEVVAGLPLIQLEYVADLPSFGLSFWNGRSWIIQLSTRQSRGRSRFTLFHEYKHIVDHGSTDRLYSGDRRRSAHVQAELAADFFAGCALVPRPLLKRAWGDQLVQHPRDLAAYFGVSEQAIEVRLDQTGLRERLPRCLPIGGSWRLQASQQLDRAA